MKQRIALVAILVLSAAAVFFGERLDVQPTPSPRALLHLVGDAERDLMRVPVSLTPLSDEEEGAIGDETAKNYLRRQNNLGSEDESIAQYVSAVGAALVKSAGRKLNYRFYYVPEEGLVNAFALPGGHIFVGKGLLKLMDTEDELAFVLGHEIEHVELRHCADRAQIQSRLSGIPLGGLWALPIYIFQAGYSKEQELEADRDGVKLAVAAGYSADGALAMFQRWEKLRSEVRTVEKRRRQRRVLDLPAEIANVVVLDSLVGYFTSHPPPQERRVRIERLIAEQRWRPGPQRGLRIQLSPGTHRAYVGVERRAFGVARAVQVIDDPAGDL
jgi:predicted Zn-dependent protease